MRHVLHQANCAHTMLDRFEEQRALAENSTPSLPLHLDHLKPTRGIRLMSVRRSTPGVIETMHVFADDKFAPASFA